ncbi:hypothetical protein ACKKBF_B37555 [Auxenochlorella protothecoides x Auxenochlorella symbiontica]
MPCCCDMVRQSAAAVARVGTHVQISKPAIAAVAASIRASHAARLVGPAAWDTRVHFRDTLRPELTLRYCLVLDALNFCFWPEPGLEYEHLATGLKVPAERRLGGMCVCCLWGDRNKPCPQSTFMCEDITPLYQPNKPLRHPQATFLTAALPSSPSTGLCGGGPPGAV